MIETKIRIRSAFANYNFDIPESITDRLEKFRHLSMRQRDITLNLLRDYPQLLSIFLETQLDDEQNDIIRCNQ